MVYSKIDILANKLEWHPKQYEKSNIYFLIDGEEIVYVGQSLDVYSRVTAHRSNKDFTHYSHFECEKADANELEDMYITLLDPHYNKKLNKYGRYYNISEIATEFDLDLQEITTILKHMNILPLFSVNYRTVDIDSVKHSIEALATGGVQND